MENKKIMRKKFLSKLGMIVGIVILCEVLFPQRNIQIAILLLLASYTLSVYFKHKSKYIEEKAKQVKHIMQPIIIEPDYKKMLVQQVIISVNDKLHCKFPDAVIDFCESDVLRMINSQQAICVAVKGAENFSHVNISLAQGGSINMNLFSLINLENIKYDEKSTRKCHRNDINIGEWFDQKGQKLLTELITNMNSRGFRQLSIKETGEVIVNESGKNTIKDYFPDIPEKKNWKKLKELMADSDVEINITGKMLTFSW